ncbi:L-type lectin-domain containing receptor kinase S-4 [Nymphaea thermarum]|nr:L-type lectin-domain containing receptor kinase S-4 [Nymphaea thermarum]
MAFLQQLVLVLFLLRLASSATDRFIFNGFKDAKLTLDGTATITSNGLLRLTNETHNLTMGHAFYPSNFRLKIPSSSSPNGTVLSFSTQFVFAIRTKVFGTSGHGLAFALSPNPSIVGGRGANYLGLFNETNRGNSSEHIFAVEFDTAQDAAFNDTDDNHIGIDVNSLDSTVAAPAAYFRAGNAREAISLVSGTEIIAWIDYRSDLQQINVSISPIRDPVKPQKPLLSATLNLSSVLKDFMYVGFSSGTGKLSSEHYILGWSFRVNGEAEPLNLSLLPPLPTDGSRRRLAVIIAYSFAAGVLLVSVLAATAYTVYKRKKKLSDIMEGWEWEYPHRFSYRVLYKATKGFKEKELLGSGGFGSVYKGVLPKTSEVVAVKRITQNARQGLREFVAEVSSLGRLRHRNLVQLQGWCRRQNDLLLVYDFMPNGSLDCFLFNDEKAKSFDWEQRFKILKGIASGLLYLHEGWEQVVVHRDVKANNVLLDAEMNGKLGDFGLARLHEHGQNPQTTRVVGTLGYMAPELSRTGKATASADVYSYGAVLLEMASGKRPIETMVSEEEGEMVLVEWVLKNWQGGDILRAMDSRLEGKFLMEEAELVLKLGVLCSQAVPDKRPTMRQVVQYLDGDAPLPKDLRLNSMVLHDDLGFDQLVLPYPHSGLQSSDSSGTSKPFSSY